jgi:ATP-binding cassette subfamily C (CFTR/MRP) protein 1
MINFVGFNQSLSLLINSWTSLETSLGVVARLRDFVEETPSEDQNGELRTFPPDWPPRGLIEIKILLSLIREILRFNFKTFC